MDLGNVEMAKRYYTEAVRLGINANRTTHMSCLSSRAIGESCRQLIFQRYPDLFVNRVTGSHVITKLSAASYLARLSLALLVRRSFNLDPSIALKGCNENFL